MIAALVLAAVAGLAVGSFLNVVAWRLPRGESLLRPGSHCTSCGKPVRPRDNVPVLSWLALRGRCRDCGAPIGLRHPVVELGTAALYVAVVAALWDEAHEVALGLALVTFLVPITLTDLDHRLIPNKLTLPAAATALVIGALLEPSFLPEMLISGAGGFLFFFLAVVAYPRGMGMGDVKLAGVMGLFLGRAVAPAIMAGLFAGVLAGAAIMARQGAAGRKTKIPFGPFLAFGALIGLFFGESLMDSYLDRF